MVELIQKVVGSNLEGSKDQMNGMRNEMKINNEHNGAYKVDTSGKSSFESQLFLQSTRWNITACSGWLAVSTVHCGNCILPVAFWRSSEEYRPTEIFLIILMYLLQQ
mgnify:CR=1 FL=1